MQEPTAAPQESEDELMPFKIIAAAGKARTLAYEALEAAKAGEFERADELLAAANDASLEAHEAQTGLLVREASGDHMPVNVMLVHAQDHLMTSMLAIEMIGELIGMQKQIHGLQQE